MTSYQGSSVISSVPLSIRIFGYCDLSDCVYLNWNAGVLHQALSIYLGEISRTVNPINLSTNCGDIRNHLCHLIYPIKWRDP